MIFCVSLVLEAFSQVNLVSSARSGLICNGDYVSFNCRTTGNILTWSYNNTRLSYPSVSGNDIIAFPGSSSIFSSLLFSGSGTFISEFVFLAARDVTSLSVTCIEDNTPRTSLVNVISKL